MRRLAAALLPALLLAGCAAPDEEQPDPLFGLCPQWAQGPGGYTAGVNPAANRSEERELGPANATHLGKPLDLYRIRLDRLEVDGRLEMRALAADGRQLAIRDYRQQAPQLVPVVAFLDGSAVGKEFDVFLAPVLHGADPAPAPVTLRWNSTGAATVDLSVTFHYKVCGL
jgi:hypothetical protein